MSSSSHLLPVVFPNQVCGRSTEKSFTTDTINDVPLFTGCLETMSTEFCSIQTVSSTKKQQNQQTIEQYNNSTTAHMCVVLRH